MKSATLNHYLESFSNPAGRFKTLSGFELQRDPQGIIRYTVRSKTVDVAVTIGGKPHVLCAPLHHESAFELKEYLRRRYAAPAFQLLLNEMLVFNDRNESGWYDLWLVESAPEQPGKSEEKKPYPTPLSYREGLAVAEKAGRYGYVDRDGNTAIPFRYDWAEPFDEGLAVVRLNDCFGLIDKPGNQVLAPVYEDIGWHSDNGVVLVCGPDGRWTLTDRRGEAVSENSFDYVFDFFHGLASVRRDGKYGYIDRRGEMIIPAIYDEGYSFTDEGLAVVVKNGITFSIDTEGMVFD